MTQHTYTSMKKSHTILQGIHSVKIQTEKRVPMRQVVRELRPANLRTLILRGFLQRAIKNHYQAFKNTTQGIFFAGNRLERICLLQLQKKTILQVLYLQN